MKFLILSLVILLSFISPISVVKAEENPVIDLSPNEQTAYLRSSGMRHFPKVENIEEAQNKFVCTDPKSCLQNVEFNTIKLEKGRKFIVKSDRRLSDDVYSGSPVIFESPQKESIFMRKTPSKVLFQGKIEKTKGPRKVGKSGVVKIKLDKITIDKITYPVDAIISKVDNKAVRSNNLMADSIYLSNLANVANEGTIHTPLKDPCLSGSCSESNSIMKPVLFLTGAALGAADLILAPIASLLKPGKSVVIPENTYFEIKLDKDLYVLNI